MQCCQNSWFKSRGLGLRVQIPWTVFVLAHLDPEIHFLPFEACILDAEFLLYETANLD